MTYVDWADAQGLGEKMGISEYLSPSAFLLNDGCVGAVIQLQGMPAITSDSNAMNELQRIWHQAIVTLGSEQTCVLTEYRRKIDTTLISSDSSDFISTVERLSVENKAYYQHDLFLTLLAHPAGVSQPKWLRKMDLCITQTEHRLNELLSIVHALLQPFQPRLLCHGEKDKPTQQVDLFQFLGLIVNAQYPSVVCEQQGDYFGSLANSLTQHQVQIGRHLTFYGPTDSEKRLGGIVSIRRYPAQTQLSSIDGLSQLPVEWIRVQSFEPLDKQAAANHIKRQRAKLRSVSDAAHSQNEALSDLQDQVAGESLSLGFHQHALMVLASNEMSLERGIAEVSAYLIGNAFLAVRERLGLGLAFWGMQSGGVRRSIRRSLITSINYSHIAQLLGYATGHRGLNHLGQPICTLETPSHMPYYFNFHVQGHANNPSLGHTLIFGASNSGKTVLLTYCDAMRAKLGGYRFFFDRDRGAELYFRAIKAPYIRFSPDHFPCSMNPFSLDDSAENRQFLITWLEQIVLLPDERYLPASERKPLTDCVNFAYDFLPPNERHLSNVIKWLPTGYARHSAIQMFVKSDTSSSGIFSDYFDNTEDTLALSSVMGFDMTYLLDRAPCVLRKAVLMYVFHRIEQVCTGECVSITLDEGWQYFADSYWREKMHSWLPTLRKLNAHLIIATQSPSSILSSTIKDIVMDNCPTQIYFANEQASQTLYCEHLKLTPAEWNWVRQALREKRFMLLKHQQDSVIVRLNLKSAEKYLPIFSSNAMGLKILDTLDLETQSDPKQWIPILLQKLAGGA